MKQKACFNNELETYKALFTNFGGNLAAHIYLSTADAATDKVFRTQLLEDECVRSCYTGMSGYEYTVTIEGPDMDTFRCYLERIRNELPGVTYRAYVVGSVKIK